MLVSLYHHCENKEILYHDLYLHPSPAAEQATFLFEGLYPGLVFIKFDLVYLFILLSDQL